MASDWFDLTGQKEPARTTGGGISEFVSEYGPAATRVADRLGTSPDNVLAHWGHETGWGKSIIPGTNNLGNIKDFSGGGVAAKDNMLGTVDKYRAYGSTDEFADDYAALIEKRYPGVIGSGDDASAFASALKKAGYAEDPDYVDKLVRTAESVRREGPRNEGEWFSLTGQDRKKFAEGGSLPDPVDVLNRTDLRPRKSVITHAATGFMDTLRQLPQLGWGLATLAAAGIEHAVGEGGVATAAKRITVDKFEEWGDKIAEAHGQDEYSLTKAYEEAKNGDSDALFAWLAYALSYGIGQGVQLVTVAGGAAKGAEMVLGGQVKKYASQYVAKEAARIATQRAGTAATAEQVAELAASEAIQKQAVSSVARRFGEIGANAAFAFGMEGGEIGGELVSENADRALSGGELARALGSIALAGSLEYGERMLGLKAIRGKLPAKPFESAPGMLGRAARAGVGISIAAPIEGATEFAQTGIEAYGEGKEESMLPWRQSPERLNAAIDAAGLGAVSGGAFGGVGGVFSSPKRQKGAPPETELPEDKPTGQPPAAPAETPPETPPEAPPAEGAPATFAQRYAATSKALTADALRSMRKDPTIGGDGVDAVLWDWSVVRNTTMTDAVRSSALDRVEAAIAKTTPQAAADTVTPAERPEPSPESPALPPDATPDLSRDLSRGDLSVPPVESPTEAAILGLRPSLQESGERRANEEALSEAIAESDARVEHAREGASRAGRMSVLDSVFMREGVKDYEAAFESALKSLGYRDTSIRPEEKTRIDRFVSLSDTFQKGEEPLPSAENEMTAESVGIPELRPAEPVVPAAGGKQRQFALVEQAVADGYKRQGKSLVHPKTGKKLNLNNAELAYYLNLKAKAIDDAAHSGQSSPLNNLPEPSVAQIEANNAKLGHVKIGRLDISIENPEGSTRRDIKNTPPKWETTMKGAHYGYIRGTIDGTGENIDAFLKSGTNSDFSGDVYVIDQIHPGSKKFDEHKSMIGYDSQQEAQDSYDANYSDGLGPRLRGAISPVKIDAFEEWTRSAGVKDRPFAPEMFDDTNTLKGDSHAAQKQGADEEVLRQEGQELGLQEVAGGDAGPTEASGQDTGRYRFVTQGSGEKAKVVPVRDFNDFEIKDIPGEGFFSYQTDDGKWAAIHSGSGLKVFGGAETRALAQAGARTRVKSLIAERGADAVINAPGMSRRITEQQKQDAVSGMTRRQDVTIPAKQEKEKSNEAAKAEEAGQGREEEALLTPPEAERQPGPGGDQDIIDRVLKAQEPGDRRKAGQPREDERRHEERRKDEQQRKRVSEMTPEEMRTALHTDELSGLLNRRAYEDGERLPVQTVVDVDSLKWVNDTMGHDSGDKLLRAVASAIKAQTDRAFRVSGDEFVVEAQTEEDARAIMGRVADMLHGAQIQVIKQDGTSITLNGLGVSYGIGGTFENADEELRRHKRDREESGKRAARGETPPGAAIVPGRQERVEDREGEASEEVKREVATRGAEREAFSALLDIPAITNAAANSPDNFRIEAERQVTHWLSSEIAKAAVAADADRAGALSSLLKDGKPVLPAEFYEGLFAEAKQRVEQQRHDTLRDASREAMALAMANAGPFDELEKGNFREAWDAALAGKTKSQIPGGAARLKGYEAAQKWLATPEGRAAYTGKRAKKLENTGADLRRWFDVEAEKITGAGDTEAIIAAVELATNRAELTRTALSDNATPGAQRWLDIIRNGVLPFKRWLFERGPLRYTVGEYAMSQAYGVRLVQYLDGTRSLTENRDESRSERVALIKKAAQEYSGIVISFAEGLNRPSTVREAALALSRSLYGDVRPEDSSRHWRLSENGKLFSGVMLSPGDLAYRYGDDKSYWISTLVEGEGNESITAKKSPLVPPRLDRIERGGTDYRQGGNVTPQSFKQTFDFADVGFGKWVGAKQDQDHLNYAYDAFRDLAALLNLPPQAISLGGRLHFTIGALGHGKFAAHYSQAHPHPDGGSVPVINVTNTRGDGTVAHGWGHALDLTPQEAGGGDLSSAIREIKQDLIYGYNFDAVHRSVMNMLRGDSWWGGDKKLRNSDEGRLRNARQSIDYYSASSRQISRYYNEALKLDGNSEKNAYWSNDKELFARAFEAWVGDTLPHESTYLVNPAWSGEGQVTAKTHRGTPYPMGEERERFATWFDALAKSLVYDAQAKTVGLDPKKWAEHKPKHREEWQQALQDLRDSLPALLEQIKAEQESKQAENEAAIAHAKTMKAGDMIEARPAAPQDLRSAYAQPVAVVSVELRNGVAWVELPDSRLADGRYFVIVERKADAELKAQAEEQSEPGRPAPAGELSSEELERLFDEAAAELSEASAEQPKAAEPGAPVQALAEGWTREDVEDILRQVESGRIILLADDKLGLPTIHDFSRNAEHLGFGTFRVSTPEYEAFMDGGGAMSRTPSGQAYTVVQVSRGTFPYDRAAVQAKLKGLLGGETTKKEAPSQVAGPLVQFMNDLAEVRARIAAQGRVVDDRLLKRERQLQQIIKELEQEAEPTLPSLDAQAEKTAGQLAAEAAKLGVKGIDEALKGLVKLFGGGPGRLQSFPAGVDKDTYAAAKPHFEAALKAFQEAGKTIKELFRFLIEQFGVGIKPYAVHFAKERALSADLGEKPSATRAVAQFVQGKLAAGEAIRWQELFDRADQAWGGTQAQGKYSPKDAYDAMEAGVNLFLRDWNLALDTTAEQARNAVVNMGRLILDKLPTQTKRDAEMDEFQQFSTPPTLAYVANWVANVTPGETMMEPSAGTGDLAIWAEKAGAALILNELSSRRAALLREVFPDARIFTENAEQLHNILPRDAVPTVVVMNPPFSATAGRMQGSRDTMNGARHIEQALKRLAPNGRLVAIVGEGMAADRPAFRQWWADIQKSYNVRANIGIDGREYAKYGTTFDNQILVIDKSGPTTGTVLTGKVASVAELPALLERIRNDRPQAVASHRDGQPAPTQPSSGEVPAPDALGGQPGQPARPQPDAVGIGQRPESQGNDGTGGLAAAPGGSTGAGGANRPGGGGAGRGGQSDGGATGGRGRSAGGGGAAAGVPALELGGATSGVTIGEAEAAAPGGELTDSVFEPYRPQRLSIPGAKPHPGKLVQSAAMAAVEPPAPTYTPNLPKAVIDQGLLSLAQLEAVVYAGQAHSQFLPNGERRGFFIGDGTGPQPLTAKVLTPGGWRLMGELAVGDAVFAADGSVTRVIGVFPQGTLPTYRLTFSDGSSTEASGGHLWLTQTRCERYYERHGLGVNYGPAKIRTTDQLATSINKLHSIPLVGAIQFERRNVEINPWLLGVLLGDGCLRESAAQVVCAEPEMVEAVRAALPAGLIARKVKTRDYHYDLVKPGRAWLGEPRQSNALLRALRGYGLAGVGAADKFVPDDYKLNTPGVRLAVLRGLMDTDGYAAAHNGSAVYYSISQRLADDVAFIVRSLGGVATRSIKKTAHNDCHIVYVKMPAGTNPFSLGRKAARVRESWEKYPPQRILRSVELIGNKECQCIRIEHPSHLYVTDDLIVTHNTGKGREISGIILDNLRQGRTKAVWVSFNEGLINDARRDFSGVGADQDLIFWQGKTRPADALSAKHGVLFTTYSTLRGGEKKQDTDTGQKKGKSRADQIVEWLGEDFDGVIVFDEAHAMGNALPMNAKRGKKKPSQQALAGIELQKRLPKARFVYVSATGATEVMNLAYAHRLGLWGEGTPFANAQTFVANVTTGGVAAMELISRDMKALGMYTARSLSFDGVTYERLDHELAPLQLDIYNELAKAWQVVLANVNAALDITNQDKNRDAKGAAMSRFWSTHQRFFNQVITSMQTPSVIEDMQRQIAAGHAVVIQLTNTNEAEQERQVARAQAEDVALEELDFTPRQALMDYVRNAFPVAQHEATVDADGNTIYKPVTDSNGNPVFDADAIALRDQLLKNLEQIRVPENPIDAIISAFGSEKVGEVTGRKRRFVQKRNEDGNLTVVEEKRGHAAARKDADGFQSDKKPILVFSQAGGTGYSFHADNTAKNRRRRIHYILQPGWRADAAVQGFGRTHRTNQANEPHYVLPTTNLKAQKRFVSSIARRLDQLGALTRGQRQASGGGLFSAADNLESKYAEDALGVFFQDLYAKQTPLDFATITQAMGLDNLMDEKTGALNTSNLPEIPRFLNRLLSLQAHEQDAVFDEFAKRLDDVVSFAIQNGTYDNGLQTLKADSVVKVRDDVAHTDERTGAQTRYVEIDVTNPVRYRRWQDAVTLAEHRKEQFAGWFKDAKGRLFGLVDMGQQVNAAGQVVRRGMKFGIRDHRNEYIDNADEVKRGFRWAGSKKETLATAVPAEQAAAEWEKQVTEAPATETVRERMIVGVILPVWDRIHGNSRIVRLQTDAGERMIGRMLGKKDAAATLKSLGLGSTAAKLSAGEILARLTAGERAILGNGWEISRSNVSGDERIEIKPPAGYFQGGDMSILKDQGVFFERIQWKDRAFIPTGENAEAVLARVLVSKPVVDLIGKNAKSNEGAPMASLRTDQPQTNKEGISFGHYQPTDAHLATLRRVEPRIAAAFREWLQDYVGDEQEAKEALASEESRLDYLNTYLSDELGLVVRDDGLMEPTWLITKQVERAIGDDEIVVKHHTATGALDAIRKDGLVRNTQARGHGNSGAGVYVTLRDGGKEVEGYQRAAVARHGGDEVTLEIRTRLRDLTPDPDDADIKSGAYQYILPAVRPEQILNLDHSNGKLVTQGGLKGLLSKGSSTAPSGETAASIRSALVERFGAKGIQALEDGGVLAILDSIEKAPAALNLRGDEEAVYDPKTGRAYLFADRIAAERAAPVLLHEIGEHYGLETMLGKKGWDALAAKVHAMSKVQGSIAAMVWEKTAEEYSSRFGDGDLSKDRGFLHEVIARLGEFGKVRSGSLWSDIVAAVKRFLLKMGIAGPINEYDVADLVNGSLRRVMREQHAVQEWRIHDARAQQAFLDAEARRRGLSNADAFAQQDMAGFFVAAEQWRQSHPMPNVRSGGMENVAASIVPSIDEFMSSGETRAKIRDAISDVFRTNKTFNVWHRTFGTQYHKAQVDKKHYGAVFDRAQKFIDSVSLFSNQAADMANDILPRNETISESFAVLNIPAQLKLSKDYEAISGPVFIGTLNDRVFSDEELLHPPEDFEGRPWFAPLDKKQIGLYRQFRAAVDASLDRLAVSEMARLARLSKLSVASDTIVDLDAAVDFYHSQYIGDLEKLRNKRDDLRSLHEAELTLLEQAAQDEASSAEQRKRYADLRDAMKSRHAQENEEVKKSIDNLELIEKGIVGRADTIRKLKLQGYAPLMRFGRYTVDVVLDNGSRLFFGMFETEALANRVAREMASLYPEAKVVQGVMSEKSWQLFRSVTPETAELFAKLYGAEQDEVFQAYLKLSTNNKSAMRRLIHRLGIAGFSQDPARVLSSFIVSNSRAAAANYHFGEMLKSVSDIPKEKGDVKDEAVALMEYIQNPREEAPLLRSLLFVSYLGGSVAAAMTNMSQTITTTFPYLHQFGGETVKQITGAMQVAARRMTKKGELTGDKSLDAALLRAEEEGVVSPHQIHMLQGEASGRGVFFGNRFTRAALNIWGAFFSLAERYNREVAFIAAYKIAEASGKGEADAFQFAKTAIEETQFIYSKAARPNWARGGVGATLFTFKTFMINYLEFLKRLPGKERAIALGTLFVLAGMSGLPGGDDLDDMIDTIMQGLGYSFNTKQQKTAFLSNVFGKHAASFVMYGASPFLPLDMQARLSVGNIVPGTAMFKKSNTDRTDDIVEWLGASGGLVKQMFTAYDQARSGGFSSIDKWTDAATSFAPKALRDIVQSLAMTRNGFYTDVHGRKVVDTDIGDAIVKFIGFNPTVVAESRRDRSIVMDAIAQRRSVMADIHDLWARGRFDKDGKKIEEAQSLLRDWNRKNPEMRITVDQSAISKRIRNMAIGADERLIRTAPREMRARLRSVMEATD